MLLTNQKTINYEKFILQNTDYDALYFVGANIVIIKH
jgi:hypothetical protein